MKYFLCVLVIALATQASAQFQCFQCQNCPQVNSTTPLVTCTVPPIVTPPAGETTPVPTTTVSVGPTNPGSQPGLTQSTPTIAVPAPTNPNTPATPPAPPNLTPTPSSNQYEVDEASSSENEKTLVRRRRQATPTTPPTTTPSPSTQFSCFELRVPVGTAGQTQINRGCTLRRGSNNQTCWQANGLTNFESCRLCSGHQCNNSLATGLVSSVFLVLATAFITLRMY